MIYIFGDSHGEFSFKNLDLPHINCKEYGITMNRIGRDNRIINFDNNYNNYQNIFVLVYGEIDCRNHIKKQINYGRKTEEVCHTLVSKYFETIKNNIIKYKIIIITAVIPATNEEKYNTNNNDFPFLGSNIERKIYREKINEYIKLFCNQNNFIYFDPYDKYIDTDGLLNYELSDKNVHIGDSKFILENFKSLISSFV
jgi:hypothetical protein